MTRGKQRRTVIRVKAGGGAFVDFTVRRIGTLDLGHKNRPQLYRSSEARFCARYESDLLDALKDGDAKSASECLMRFSDRTAYGVSDRTLDWIAGLFKAQPDACALRYDPEHALQFDGYERLGPAAVIGEVGFTRGSQRITVYRLTDAEILGGNTWTPSPDEDEVLEHWTSTAAGRIDLAHKTIAAGSVPLALFWGHTYD